MNSGPISPLMGALSSNGLAGVAGETQKDILSSVQSLIADKSSTGTSQRCATRSSNGATIQKSSAGIVRGDSENVSSASQPLGFYGRFSAGGSPPRLPLGFANFGLLDT